MAKIPGFRTEEEIQEYCLCFPFEGEVKRCCDRLGRAETA